MPTPEEEMQAAADRGELQTRSNVQIRKQIEQTERRWIVMQVKEIAVAWDGMTAKDFKELCEFIRDFTQLAPTPAPDK